MKMILNRILRILFVIIYIILFIDSSIIIYALCDQINTVNIILIIWAFINQIIVLIRIMEYMKIRNKLKYINMLLLLPILFNIMIFIHYFYAFIAPYTPITSQRYQDPPDPVILIELFRFYSHIKVIIIIFILIDIIINKMFLKE